MGGESAWHAWRWAVNPVVSAKYQRAHTLPMSTFLAASRKDFASYIRFKQITGCIRCISFAALACSRPVLLPTTAHVSFGQLRNEVPCRTCLRSMQHPEPALSTTRCVKVAASAHSLPRAALNHEGTAPNEATA